MSNCPVCNTEYTEGQRTCSSCSWVLELDSQPVISWAKQVWSEKCQLELKCQTLEKENQQLRDNYQKPLVLTEERTTPSFSELSQLNDLQELLKQTMERVDQLEQSQQKNLDNFNSQREALESQFKNLNLKEISQEIVSLKQEQSQIQSQLSGQFQEELQVKDQLSKIETRLNELEEYLKAKKQLHTVNSTLLENYPFNQGEQELQYLSQTKAKQELSWEEHQLIKEYNGNLEELSKRASEVSETEKSISERRMSSSSTVIFEKKRRGNYLILKEGGYEYLVPSNNLRINQHNYKTVEALFECRGFQPGYSEDFKLFKPAKVSASSNAETWQLDEPGILQF